LPSRGSSPCTSTRRGPARRSRLRDVFAVPGASCRTDYVCSSTCRARRSTRSGCARANRPPRAGAVVPMSPMDRRYITGQTANCCGRADRDPGGREIAGHTVGRSSSRHRRSTRPYLGSHFPTGLGYASVFEVEQAGAEVDPSRVGTRAICLGGHVVAARRRGVGRVRAVDVGFEQATFARMMVVTMSTLTTTVARPPQPALVVGLAGRAPGGADLRVVGYDVTACDPSERRREIALERGRCGRVLPAVPVVRPGGTRWRWSAPARREARWTRAASCASARGGARRRAVAAPHDHTAHELLPPDLPQLRGGAQWWSGRCRCTRPTSAQTASTEPARRAGLAGSGRVAVDVSTNPSRLRRAGRVTRASCTARRAPGGCVRLTRV